MYTPINESLGREKLTITAGAATVGRPTGVDGKKMSPRRARVTSKELEKLNTKGLKAGGPGSGRRSEGGHEVGDKVYVHPNYGGGHGRVTEVSDDGKYVTVKGKEGEDIHHFSDLSKKPFKNEGLKAGGPGSGRHKVGDTVLPKGGNKPKYVIAVNYDNRTNKELTDDDRHAPVAKSHFIKVGNTKDADPAKTTWSKAEDYIPHKG